MINPIPRRSLRQIEELRGQVAALEALLGSILPLITDWRERDRVRGWIEQGELAATPETVFNRAMQDTLDRLLREADTA